MPRLQEVKNKGRIIWSLNLPEEKRESLKKKGWKKGDLLDVNFNEEGDLVIKKV